MTYKPLALDLQSLGFKSVILDFLIKKQNRNLLLAYVFGYYCADRHSNSIELGSSDIKLLKQLRNTLEIKYKIQKRKNEDYYV